MEKKYSKKDYYYNAFLIVIVLLFTLLLTRGKYFYGSTKDWEVQHYAFADYFRKLFYSNQKIFPQFALNLGCGENIYYFSYYGLFSPLILLSYLFPFISMRSYVQIMMVIIVMISVLLFYRWIFLKYGTTSAFLSTFIFLMSSPLIFHSHRHIMFVNYMPFLLLALIGVERHFKEKKSNLLIISIVLMFFTSFYFSVSAVIWITLYAISYWIDINKEIRISDFIRQGMRFASRIIIAIMICGVLLFPTAYTILNGRPQANTEASLVKAMIPNLNVNFMFYGHYSMGLTAVFAIAVAYFCLWGKKGKRFLAFSFMTLTYFGVISYVLNGFMYLDGKVFIPLLPIGCYLLASFFQEIRNLKINVKVLGLVLAIASVGALIRIDIFKLGYIVDLIVTFIVFCVCINKNKQKIFEIVVCIICAGICIGVNCIDKLVDRDTDYIVKENEYNKVLEDISMYDNDLYRISTGKYESLNYVYRINQLLSYSYSSSFNLNFGEFYNDRILNENSYRNCLILSPSNNLIYNMYIGNKYVIGNDIDIKGYKQTIYGNDSVNVYKSEDALPIAYSTDKTMSYEQYEELDYPYNVVAIKNYVISDDGQTININDCIQKLDFGSIKDYDVNNILETNFDNLYKYKINFKKDVNDKSERRIYKSLTIPIPEEYQNKVFFVKIQVDNTNYLNSDYISKDINIKVNGVINKLTDPQWKYYNNNESFEYTISSNNKIENIEVKFSDGEYLISDMEIYMVDYEDLITNYDRLKVNSTCNDKKANKLFTDTVIEGTINCKSNEKLVFSFPYDEGFKLFIDGKETNIEKVDVNFCGADILTGEHEVKLTFQAPFFKLGLIVSILGIILCVGSAVYDNKVYNLIKVL